MQYWSWVLAFLGVFGTLIIGKLQTWGWIVLLVDESLWVVYALQTHQDGFLVMSMFYFAVYVRSLRAWTLTGVAKKSGEFNASMVDDSN